jgi:hypothetical protein
MVETSITTAKRRQDGFAHHFMSPKLCKEARLLLSQRKELTKGIIGQHIKHFINLYQS